MLFGILNGPHLVSCVKDPFLMATDFDMKKKKDPFGEYVKMVLLFPKNKKEINSFCCTNDFSTLNNETILYKACRLGRDDIVQKLLRVPMIDVNKGHTNGDTPLAISCTNGHEKCISLLFKYHSQKLDINKYDQYGFTPLMVICGSEIRRNLSNDILNLFLGQPSLQANKKSKNGKLLLEVAASNHNFDWFKMLCRHKQMDINDQDSDGFTILNFLCSIKNWTNRNYDKFFDYLMSKALKKKKKALKKKKISVNLPNHEGKTPLHFACEFGKLGYVEKLLNHPEIDVNQQDKYGNSALHFVCKTYDNIYEKHDYRISCYPLTIKLLLEQKNINVNLRNNKNPENHMFSDSRSYYLKYELGLTPLHIAAIYRSPCLMSLIHDSRIQLNVLDNCSFTPLFYLQYRFTEDIFLDDTKDFWEYLHIMEKNLVQQGGHMVQVGHPIVKALFMKNFNILPRDIKNIILKFLNIYYTNQKDFREQILFLHKDSGEKDEIQMETIRQIGG